MPVQQIISGDLIPNSPNFSDWFQGASYLFFVAPDRPDWSVDGNFTEIDAALLVEVPGGLTRQVPLALGQITTREPILVPSELVRSGARMRLVLDASFAVALEGYAVSEATIAAIVTSLTLRERADGSAPIDPREATIDSASGVLSVGKDGGPAWRYLPEGYGPPVATADALQQLADDLASLRAIAATDEDLAAEVADLQAAIDAVIASGATDSELSAALAPIQSAIAALTSQDSTTATAIAAVQASIAGLDAVYATDVQLAQAIAALGLPVRSATAPAFGVNVRWTELDSNGAERYPWTWTTFNRGTIEFPQWEWRAPEVVAPAAIQTGTTTQTVRIPYPWRSRGDAAARYRLIAARSSYSAAAAAGAANWSVRAFLERVATATTQPQAQVNLGNWDLVSGEGKAQTAASTSSLVAIPLIDEDAGGITVTVTPFAAGYTRSAIGSISLTFVPVRV